MLYLLPITSGAFYEATANKRRKYFPLKTPACGCCGHIQLGEQVYNLEGEYSTELVDGVSSRVFQGTRSGTLVKIEQIYNVCP